MVDFVFAAFACLAKCFVVKIALCLHTHSFIVCYFVCFTVPLAEPIASVAVAVESVPGGAGARAAAGLSLMEMIRARRKD